MQNELEGPGPRDDASDAATNAAPDAGGVDADLEAAKEPTLAHIAGGTQAFAGALTALTALQQIGTVSWRSFLFVMPYVELLLGVAVLALAFRTYRARRRGSLAAAIASISLAPIVGAWTVFATISGFVTCIAFLAPVVGLFGGALGFAALSSIRRCSDARERLAEQGLSFGV